MGNFCLTSEKEDKKPDSIFEPLTSTTVGAETLTSTNGKSLSETDFLSVLKMNKIQTDSASDAKATKLYQPLEISRNHSISFNSQIRIDIAKKDYRAFCLLIHRTQGVVLLHCTKKKKKPPHYQLPGGNVDNYEFKKFSRSLSNLVTQEQLYRAAQMGCAREVYEETGIDLRNRLEQLLPLVLYDTSNKANSTNEKLINEYKSRIFFVCEVFDEDFPCAPVESMECSTARYPSLPNDFSCDLMLQLSEEHSGFCFVKESSEIAKQLTLHSGGKVETAITMAYNLVVT